MSLSLPPAGSPAREALGDLAHVVDVCSPAKRAQLPTFSHGLRSIACPQGARAVNVLCLRASGDIALVAIGPKGGRKVLWNLGQ